MNVESHMFETVIVVAISIASIIERPLHANSRRCSLTLYSTVTAWRYLLDPLFLFLRLISPKKGALMWKFLVVSLDRTSSINKYQLNTISILSEG